MRLFSWMFDKHRSVRVVRNESGQLLAPKRVRFESCRGSTVCSTLTSFEMPSNASIPIGPSIATSAEFAATSFIANARLGVDMNEVRVVSIHDGDTFSVDLGPCLIGPLRFVSVRILGIDTAEIDSKDAKTKELAWKARKALVDFFADAKMLVDLKVYGWDKFGGRLDCDVFVGDTNVATMLIKAGLAKEYNGKGPRPTWP